MPRQNARKAAESKGGSERCDDASTECTKGRREQGRKRLREAGREGGLTRSLLGEEGNPPLAAKSYSEPAPAPLLRDARY